MVKFRFWKRTREPDKPKNPPAEEFKKREPQYTMPTLSFELKKGQELKIDIAGHRISLKPILLYGGQDNERLLCEVIPEDGIRYRYSLVKGSRHAVFLTVAEEDVWVIGVRLVEVKYPSGSPVFVIERDMIAEQVDTRARN